MEERQQVERQPIEEIDAAEKYGSWIMAIIIIGLFIWSYTHA